MKQVKDDPETPPIYKAGYSENWFITKVLIWILVIVLIVSMVSCAPKHYKTTQARYNPYDKDGLLKSSTPLYLDKNNGRKTKNRVN